MAIIMYTTRRTTHFLNRGEGNFVISVVHVTDKCVLEEESWQVGRRLELGGIFHLQQKGNKAVDGRINK